MRNWPPLPEPSFACSPMKRERKKTDSRISCSAIASGSELAWDAPMGWLQMFSARLHSEHGLEQDSPAARSDLLSSWYIRPRPAAAVISVTYELRPAVCPSRESVHGVGLAAVSPSPQLTFSPSRLWDSTPWAPNGELPARLLFKKLGKSQSISQNQAGTPPSRREKPEFILKLGPPHAYAPWLHFIRAPPSGTSRPGLNQKCIYQVESDQQIIPESISKVLIPPSIKHNR